MYSMSINDYKKLFVWQQSISLATKAYKFTSKLPKQESFGISSQIQRAAVSIPSNIAEGYGRKSRKEYLQFLYIANGSASELETHIIICSLVYKEAPVDYIEFINEISSVRGLINLLIKKLS